MIEPDPHFLGANLYSEEKTWIEYYDASPEGLRVGATEGYGDDAELTLDQAEAFGQALLDSVAFARKQKGKPIALTRPKKYLVQEDSQ